MQTPVFTNLLDSPRVFYFIFPWFCSSFLPPSMSMLGLLFSLIGIYIFPIHFNCLFQALLGNVLNFFLIKLSYSWVSFSGSDPNHGYFISFSQFSKALAIRKLIGWYWRGIGAMTDGKTAKKKKKSLILWPYFVPKFKCLKIWGIYLVDDTEPLVVCERCDMMKLSAHIG